MKNSIKRLCLIFIWVLMPLGVTPEIGHAAANNVCNSEEFARLEANFQQMIEFRARQPEVFSDEELKAAALAYVASAEKCLQAAAQAQAQTDTDPVVIDEGGLSPVPGLGPLFNTIGFKWGGNSPYPAGQNVPGPGTPGGTVTYSYIPAGIAHAGGVLDDGGTNVNVLTSLGVNSCVKNEIAAAFAAWSAIADIQFVEVADSGAASNTPGATGNIRIGAHAMDGAGGTLAHAFFPYVSGDTTFSIAGDLHFDAAESWSCSPNPGLFDIGLVTLHEIGHSIGLGHEPSGGNLAVMNPTYNPSLSSLQTDDINGAISIYGIGAGLIPNACIPLFTDTHEDGFGDWTVSNGAGANNWQGRTDGGGYGGSSNYWFVADVGSVTDSYLTSQTINATQDDLTLNFLHFYDLESENNNTGYDGGVVEISVNGGAFNDVGSANFTRNGYNKTIDLVSGSPLAGRPAFSGNSGIYVESVINLSGLVSQGDNFRVRFREANDMFFDDTGWRVDNVKVCTVLKTYLPLILK